MQITDFLIIGQGISGSVLAFKLRKAGFNVKVVDKMYSNSSSRVAAGIWHPMVFKRLSQTWLAHEFVPNAEETYAEMELELNSKFFYASKYGRLLSSITESNDWETLSGDDKLSDWMGSVQNNDNTIFNEFQGKAAVKHAGYLDTEKFLGAVRTWLREDLIDDFFQDEQLKLTDSGVVYTSSKISIKAQKVIFANGLHVQESSWFSWVPFAPVKGEVITIFSPQLRLNEIISKGVFICPIGNHRYNVGATYHWDKIDTIPTVEGLNELTQKLEELIHVPFDVVDHRAGVRPAVKGRRPLLGSHPSENRVNIFNGMGSKAVLMVPFLASHLIDYLTKGESLMDDVNLKRFYSFYTES